LVIRNVWTRLSRKQLLVLYPFTVGLINTLAFLAVYFAVEPDFDWTHFADSNFLRMEYLQENVGLDSSPLVLLAAVGAGLLLVVLRSAIRAPFFRAIVGLGYPKSPAGWGELARLSMLYLLIYVVVVVVPYSFPVDGAAFAWVSLIAFFIAITFLYADYALVFEQLGPVAAIRRSIDVLGKSLLPGLIIYFSALLAWWAMQSLYQGYFDGGGEVFILLPLSFLLIDAVITMVVDAFLIFLYFDRARS